MTASQLQTFGILMSLKNQTIAKLCNIILICFLGEVNAQIPELPIPGMYKQLQELKIRTITFWSCKDSLCTSKERTSFMKFDSKSRIEKEVYIEDGKEVPYEVYQYPNKNTIIKKFNADNQYWLTYKYQLNDKGNVLNESITSKDCYKIENKYSYKDSLLISKEIIDSSCEPYLDAEGIYNYEYNKKRWLIKLFNEKIPETVLYEYNEEGNLIKKTEFGTNPEWEKHTVEYFYSDGKLTKLIEEDYVGEDKEGKSHNETYYTYNEIGLLSITYLIKQSKKSYQLITYEFN